MASSWTAAGFALALVVSSLTACGSSSGSDADGGLDARPAADAADTNDTNDTNDGADAAGDAPPVGCALGSPCSAEGATCTWNPPCGYPPSVPCTCSKGVWSCSPACI